MAYLFQTRFGGGGGLIETGRVLERKGLFDLVKIVVSALHEELECKVKSSIEEVEVHAAKGQKQIRPSNMWINHQSKWSFIFMIDLTVYHLSVKNKKGRREGGF